MKEQETVFGETVNYGLPRVYKLYKDPGETQNVLFPETWVPQAALRQLGEHMMSLQKNRRSNRGHRTRMFRQRDNFEREKRQIQLP